jgi:hypothetical protein
MKRHEFTKDTRYLYTALMECSFDCPETFPVTFPILKALAEGDMEGIRQAFCDGMVAMMAPDLMPALEEIPDGEEIEIRITHERKTIGIVIDSEITW